MFEEKDDATEISTPELLEHEVFTKSGFAEKLGSLIEEHVAESHSALDKREHDIVLLIKQAVAANKAEMDEREKNVTERERRMDLILEDVKKITEDTPTMIKMRVGSKLYCVSGPMLLSQGESYFTHMLHPQTKCLNAEREYFVPRDPDIFAKVLEWFTYGTILHLPDSEPAFTRLETEANFYCLDKLKLYLAACTADAMESGKPCGCKAEAAEAKALAMAAQTEAVTAKTQATAAMAEAEAAKTLATSAELEATAARADAAFAKAEVEAAKPAVAT